MYSGTDLISMNSSSVLPDSTLHDINYLSKVVRIAVLQQTGLRV